MRIRLFILVTLLLATALLPTSSTSTTSTAPDCETVNNACNLVGRMVYDTCILMGCEPSYCTEQEAQARIECKTENGCPPPPIGE